MNRLITVYNLFETQIYFFLIRLDPAEVNEKPIVVSTQVKEKEDIVTMNGDHIHITESKLTVQAFPQKSTLKGREKDNRGRREVTRNRSPLTGDHVTSETESEEEFCDTSDQPSQVGMLMKGHFLVLVYLWFLVSTFFFGWLTCSPNNMFDIQILFEFHLDYSVLSRVLNFWRWKYTSILFQSLISYMPFLSVSILKIFHRNTEFFERLNGLAFRSCRDCIIMYATHRRHLYVYNYKSYIRWVYLWLY